MGLGDCSFHLKCVDSYLAQRLILLFFSHVLLLLELPVFEIISMKNRCSKFVSASKWKWEMSFWDVGHMLIQWVGLVLGSSCCDMKPREFSEWKYRYSVCCGEFFIWEGLA
jgi:hypothetical protein